MPAFQIERYRNRIQRVEPPFSIRSYRTKNKSCFASPTPPKRKQNPFLTRTKGQRQKNEAGSSSVLHGCARKTSSLFKSTKRKIGLLLNRQTRTKRWDRSLKPSYRTDAKKIRLPSQAPYRTKTEDKQRRAKKIIPTPIKISGIALAPYDRSNVQYSERFA